MNDPNPEEGLYWFDVYRPGLRPVERGAFPLAHGTAERVGRLRGYGDGIVAQAAKAFIEAYLEDN